VQSKAATTVKLAHLADLHLGFRQYYRLTPNGINQREADVARAFGSAVDDVVQMKPDIIVLAGDLFHSVRPTNAAILYAFNQLRRLRAELPDTEIIIVAGNHDTPRSVETGTILRLFEALGGVHVVAADVRELLFDHLGLSVVCVPHTAWMSGRSGVPLPQPSGDRKVLVTHGEIAGVLSHDSSNLEYGGALVEPGDLGMDSWDYVALGHYHVAREIAPNAWYSGSLEYVSANPWGELIDEAREGRRGKKGWLLVSFEERPRVEFRVVPPARALVDLEPIQGDGLGAADLDRAIADRVASLPGGIADNIVRQVVFDVPRPIARDMDHGQIREFKTQALHYNLDIRRPPAGRLVGIGAPGRRQTLSELVRDFLSRRMLTAEVDRNELIALAGSFMDEVEQDLLED
jgi:exonuclease SbcD